MALQYGDLVQETTTSTGTGALTLSALSGYRRFSTVMSVSDTCYYTIRFDTEYEVGLGTYSGANTLTRTTILASSNSNAAVSLAAGTKTVYMTVPAAKLAAFDLAQYAATITASSGATISAATHGQGVTPKVVITRSGIVVDCLVTIDPATGNVTWASAEAFTGKIVISR
jgi:hypothetical protein